MVALVNINGNSYIICEVCGGYEQYNVSKLHIEQDKATKWLCRQCMPLSCIIAK